MNRRSMEKHKKQNLSNIFESRPRDPVNKISQHSSSISFDSFIFVDNFTNKKIIMKDAKSSYEPIRKLKKKIHNKTYEQQKEQKEIQNLQCCIATLKTTKLFQMDSLRSKIFKSTHIPKDLESHENNNERRNILKKKKLRQLIQQTIKEITIKELREYVQNTDHRVSSKVMCLQKLEGKCLTKESIINIIKDSKKKILKHQGINHFTRDQNNHLDELELSFEGDEFIEKMQQYLKNTIKANNSHLIKPEYHKELYEKIYDHFKLKNRSKKGRFIKGINFTQNIKGTNFTQNIKGTNFTQNIKGTNFTQNIKQSVKQQQKQKQRQEDYLKRCEFKLSELQPHLKEMRLKVCCTKKKIEKQQSAQEKEILFAIVNNLDHELQMRLIQNKQLINTRDSKGNSLLHIAVMNRNVDQFKFLLKKMGMQGLTLTNNLKKMPKDMAQIYGVKEIRQICDHPQYLLHEDY